LSIKQAAEGGIVAAEYQEHFGEHAYDNEGNFIGGESSEGQEAWADMFTEADAEATGEVVGSVDLPAGALGTPMTYLHDGRQFVGLTIGGETPELIALAVPEGR
ncbi:MAG TPA: hypothetical protein EYQ83_06360, partial [Acidobacteria bacterium]|nr:hypothetical protein [Acidobacteriota bacterium]